MTRDEAARVLEQINYMQCTGDPTIDAQKAAVNAAIAALRDNPCDNCIGPALAISHGYKDMRTKKPEVEE